MVIGSPLGPRGMLVNPTNSRHLPNLSSSAHPSIVRSKGSRLRRHPPLIAYSGLNKEKGHARVEGSRWRRSSFGWSPPRWFSTTDSGAARVRVDSTDESSPQ
eukprot:scaffold15795_cov110-Isochrysis_galbana.AAC.1